MIDPVQKQDLLLIKEAFERKALEQNSREAQLLPMVDTLSQSRQIHQNIRGQLTRYPASKIQGEKRARNILKQIQAECVPCTARIKALGDLDIGDDLFTTLGTYNIRALSRMIELFKSVSRPNTIQQDLCDAYKALRSQCIPDISRLIAALSLLMRKLRSFSLKSLKNELMSLIGGLISRTMSSAAINYDMYVRLITDTLKCVVADIKTQLGKLQPILSREGLEDIASLAPLDRTDPSNPSFTISQQEAARRKVASWFPNQVDDQGNPVDFDFTRDISKRLGDFNQQIDQKLNSFTNLNQAVGIGQLLTDMVDSAISNADEKLDNATREFLKFLKLSDSNLQSQIELISQIQLIQSLLEVLQTIKDTRGDFNPCGQKAGRKFFTRIKFPGQEIIVEDKRSKPEDPEDIEITIVPPQLKVDNPVVKDILREQGLLKPLQQVDSVDNFIDSGEVIQAVPVTINLSKCLDGSNE